jgi:pimeloyl-ACP methyl ester carboxylesterase
MSSSLPEVPAPAGPSKHLVILVHGINTQAQWFGIIKPALEDAGFTVAPAGYGMHGLVRFLLPLDWFRLQAIEKVTTKIRLALEVHRPQQVSVIAHSFGSYVIARIMAAEFNLKWHRIIFCGSVVRDDFKLEQFLPRFTQPIVNEIGTRDCWPAIAKAVTWGYGSVGANGFQSPAVEERWHTNFRHSDFLNPEFCNKFWVSFLRDGRIERGDRPSPLPWYVRLLARLPLRWCILVLFSAICATPFFVDVTQLNPLRLFAGSDSPALLPQPVISWSPLPAGTRIVNDTENPVVTFVEANKSGAKSFNIGAGQVVPPFEERRHFRRNIAAVADG